MPNYYDEPMCAFQYYAEEWHEMKEVKDVAGITLDEAKRLYNSYYQDMVRASKNGLRLEVAIWVNMAHDCDYRETLIHLQDPVAENGVLAEKVTTYHRPFKMAQD